MPDGPTPTPSTAAITREELDKLPVLPVLVYVDNQRNRYEFRTHPGTMQQLREMDSRDLAIVRALAEHLAQDALQAQLEEIERS